MSKRAVVVGGATGVAGLVLGASIVFGPPAVTGSDEELPDVAAPEVGGLPTGDRGSIGIRIRGFDYTTVEFDDDGELRGMRLRADDTNPIKRMGVTELVRPRAEVYLGAQTAITIHADHANMKMEDDKPREGEFTGNVVVTLFQAPEGTRLVIDPDDPAHKPFIQQRIYLDETTDFNIEDDRIHTRGPVHVTSPQLDFFGQGLRLTYNTQRERIEQLLVSEGRYLIINPEADPPGFEDQAEKDASKSEEAGDTPEPPGPSQYYTVRFRDDVIVRDRDESELGGDVMQIEFSLGTEAVSPKPITPTSGLPMMLALPGARLAQADPATTTDNENAAPLAPNLPVVSIPRKNIQRSLFDHDPMRDVVVTWTGPMEVTPLAQKPEALADDDDVRFTLTGGDTYAQTTRNGDLERLESVRLEYLLSQERTEAVGGDERALRILSTAMGGEITGQRLIVRQKDGSATIYGPGQLTYTDREDGRPLTLTWSKRLDLDLFTALAAAEDDALSGDDRAGLSRDQTKVLGVKTATFDGDVTARHPDFDLDADRLTLAFAEPDEANGIENTPTSINALGGVAIHARGDDEAEEFDITAEHLTIALSLDSQPEPEPYASSIRATGGVRIEQPGSSMTCNRVDVTLAEPNPDNPADNAPAKEDRFAEVRTVFAVGDVHADLEYDNRRIDLVADELIGDVEQDKLTLSSKNPDKPAEVVDIANDRKLAGKLIVMDNRAEALTISGPGSLATRLDDPEKPDATIEDAFLNVAWSRSMSFNNVTGEAEFIDDVRSESRRSTDTSELTCDHLAMVFSPDYAHDPARLIDDPGKDAHERQVRSAVATGDVRFMAAAWDPLDPDQVTTRLRVEGPTLTFTNKPAIEVGGRAVESVVVEGKGLMVIEDYRPPDDADETASADAERDPVMMSGRGATLFEWDDAMVLDVRTNTAVLTRGVVMVHQSKDEAGQNVGTPIQLNCERLVADMTDTGGLGAWAGGDAPDATLNVVTADDNVSLIHTERSLHMQADHLKFTEATQLVELWPDENKDILITDQASDTVTRTQKVSWDLTRDRVLVDDIRGNAVPLE